MTSTQSLKTQLFSTLSKQGFHDDIKKQVRIKLVEQLKDKKALETKSQTKNFFKRVLSSLIMQELQISGQSLTESVYSIESGFEGAHMTRNELIQLLTFNKNSINQDESLLEFILGKNQPFSSSTLQNQEIQTNAEEIGYTLEQKLMMVDQEYRINLMQKQNISKNNLLDRKKLEFELEQKFKKQTDMFKEFQVHKIKIKVGEEWRIKFENYSNQIAEEYQRKYDLIRKKDKQLNEEYVQKHNQLNVKMNESQKMIQQKIELLDMKSTTVNTQMQNLERAKKDFQQLMGKREKQLQDKIKEYDNLLLNIKQKIRYEVNLAKLSLQQEYQDKEAESMRRKKVIDEDYGKLMGIKDSIDIVEKENVRLSDENTNLRNHLVTVEKQLKDTVVQLGNKVSRIEVLKDDLIQMTETKKNMQQKIKQETKKSKRYQSEIIAMREQLDKLRAKQNMNRSNISELEGSELQVKQEKNAESKKIEEVNRRMEKLKNQRKKDIEKFRMEI